MKLINKIVTQLKGETFILDESIPVSYMLSFFFSKTLSLVWGMIRLYRFQFFVHPSSVIKCSSKINYGKKKHW